MQRNEFKTTDMYLSAFLLAKNHEIRVVELTPTQREFRFPTEAEADAQSYYQNAPIAARAYASAMRDIKQLLHSNQNSNKENSYVSSRFAR